MKTTTILILIHRFVSYRAASTVAPAHALKPSAHVGLTSSEHRFAHEAHMAQHVRRPFLFRAHVSQERVGAGVGASVGAGEHTSRPSVYVGLASFEHWPSHEPPLAQHVRRPFLFTAHVSQERVDGAGVVGASVGAVVGAALGSCEQTSRPSANVGLASFEHWPSHEAPFAQHETTPFLFFLHVGQVGGGRSQRVALQTK